MRDFYSIGAKSGLPPFRGDTSAQDDPFWYSGGHVNFANDVVNILARAWPELKFSLQWPIQ